jgi:hypothetical protein
VGAAEHIEKSLAERLTMVMRTLPSEMEPTEDYLLVSEQPFGIDAELALRASWRAKEAYRYPVSRGFMLLGVAPPELSNAWPMLIYAYDPQDGSPTQLRGSWWLHPRASPTAPVAFARWLANTGTPLTHRSRSGLLLHGLSGDAQPTLVDPDRTVELHCHREFDQWGQPLGWTWCFAVDRDRYEYNLTHLYNAE